LARLRAKTNMWLFVAGGGCAIALMLVRLAVNRQFEVLIDGSLVWLALSLVVAGGFISWGHLKPGHPVVSLNLASMVTAIAAVTGGLESFLLPWLLLVPIGAVFSASLSYVAFASVLAFASLGGLYLGQVWSLLPPAHPQDVLPVLQIAGMATALAYAVAHGAAGYMNQAPAGGYLARWRDFNRLIIENSKDTYSIHDRTGRAHMVSAGASGIFGASATSLHDAALLGAIHDLDREAFVDACASAVDRKEACETEMRLWSQLSKTGKYIWVRGQFRPTELKFDAEPSCLVVIRDISDHKLQENLLRDSHEAASRADQAKSRLLANVTHELRTPLNAIIGFSDILDGELKDNKNLSDISKLNRYIDLINESGTHLLQVVNDLLEMSRIEAGEAALTLEDFDLGELLMATAKMVEPFAISSGVRLKFDFSPALGSVIADKRAIKQIVINLLSNAVKFSNEGSCITIGAGVGEYAATFWVEDEGIGIAKRDLSQLGQPFFQADGDVDRRFEGTGLGLCVVKKLVQFHDGSMQIESTPGRGTTVRIKFPRHADLNGTAKPSKMLANGAG